MLSNFYWTILQNFEELFHKSHTILFFEHVFFQPIWFFYGKFKSAKINIANLTEFGLIISTFTLSNSKEQKGNDKRPSKQWDKVKKWFA